MKSENEKLNGLVLETPDFLTTLALLCPAEGYLAIEEIEIKPSPLDPKRFTFVFEKTSELEAKLEAFRKGELLVEPSQFFHLSRQLKQELFYLKESLKDGK